MRTLFIKTRKGSMDKLVLSLPRLEMLVGHLNKAGQGLLSNAAFKATDILR